ncbi:hypothetical protein ACQZ5N_03385 [Agrobacterium sp. 22-221-1]|nr:hypothetical protein FY137_07075 [Agrobacterium tumefaciens]
MADYAAWGDDMLDYDREDGDDAYVDWSERGQFRCDMCTRVLSTAGGLKCHATSVHGEEYGNSIKAKIRAAHKAKAEDERARRAAEAKRIQDRRNRKVTLSTAEVDEIIEEINSLIDKMEPYYAQGDCADPARDLIERLEAKAEGKS